MKRARKRSWLQLAFRNFRRRQKETMMAVRRHNTPRQPDNTAPCRLFLAFVTQR